MFMGLNLDLVKMMNAPKEFVCEICGTNNQTHFEDYDIECGETNPSPGKWILHRYCTKCGHESAFIFEVFPMNMRVGEYE
jgi:hypothetical protein